MATQLSFSGYQGVCYCGSAQVVLEGLSSGGEYEDEHRVSAAIAMAEATSQTGLLDYKEHVHNPCSFPACEMSEQSYTRSR